MLIIIPFKKSAAEDARLSKIGKRCRKLRLILGRFEERLDVRVVVGNVRSRVTLRHAQIREHERDGLRGQRAAAIGIHAQLGRNDALLADRFG